MHVLSFNERAKSLENVFFQQVDQRLLADIRSALAERQAKEAIQEASGIQNEELLAELVRIEVQPETLAAVSLIPLIAIAWADGKVSENERYKILAAERDAGISEDSPSHQLLEHWLASNPGDEFFSTWKHFVVELQSKLTPAVSEILDKDLVERAQAVARASGGYLTYGSVSPAENKIVEEMKETLRSAEGS